MKKIRLTEEQLTPIYLDLREAEKTIQKYVLLLQEHYPKNELFVRNLENARRSIERTNAVLVDMAEIY